ncbi:unnamed protein product [Bemisia tabaci]|uniref:Uncharacterized protein n=1 Tax=Bemisia tabaci TaxID=7038 RepID=A0A9P0A9I7_BEMTA|nr:unnamed protein product [Bemisia tabaci]
MNPEKDIGEKSSRGKRSPIRTPQIRKIGNAPVKRLLESLGGWPVTTSEWTPPPFAVEYLFGRLKAEFNEGVLVEQWVGPDDKNSSMNILQVRPKTGGGFVAAGPPPRRQFFKHRPSTTLVRPISAVVWGIPLAAHSRANVRNFLLTAQLLFQIFRIQSGLILHTLVPVLSDQ